MPKRKSLIAGDYNGLYLTDLQPGQLLRIETRSSTLWVTTLAISTEEGNWVVGLMVQVSGGNLERTTRNAPSQIMGLNFIEKGRPWPLVAGEDHGASGTITRLVIESRS